MKDPWPGLLHDGSVYLHSVENGRERTRLTLREGDWELRLDAHGALEFDDDDRGFVLDDPGDALTLRVRSAHGERSWRAGHGVRESYEVDGAPAALEGEGRVWLADCVLAVARRTPFGAEQRADRILRTGGVHAVLAELEHLRDDQAAAIYLERLGAPGALGPEELRAAIEATRKLAVASSARARFYALAATATTLDGPLRRSLIEATATLPSHEVADVLAALAMGSRWDEPSAAHWLERAALVMPGSRRTDLLVCALDVLPRSESLRLQWLELVSGVEGASNQERLLVEFLRREDSSEAELRAVAGLVGSHVASSSARARVLEAVARHPGATRGSLEAVLEGLDALGSSSDRVALLLAVLESPRVDREMLALVSRAVDGISSPGDRDRIRAELVRRLLAAPAQDEARRQR